MKEDIHMESTPKAIIANLKTESHISTITVKFAEDVILNLTQTEGNNVDLFFSKLIEKLIIEPFSLKLECTDATPQLVKEVAKEYIDRLNIEITSVLNSEDYKTFSTLTNN